MNDMRTLAFLMKEAARVLAPYAELVEPDTKTWDGKRYVADENRYANVIAAKWWGVLSTLGEMLEMQDAALSRGQLDYLEHLLFGGMGSFVDFRLDPASNEKILKANKEIADLTGAMFAAFKELRLDSLESKMSVSSRTRAS
jgi:hypothetical protein